MESYLLPIGSNISRSNLKTWNKNILPLTVDTEDFITNHALSLNSYLHQQTLFQVVNETFAENWNGTSLFWSEKHLEAYTIYNHLLYLVSISVIKNYKTTAINYMMEYLIIALMMKEIHTSVGLNLKHK